MLGATLNTLHNLFFYLDTMRAIREAIEFGSFEEFRQNFHRTFSRQPSDCMSPFDTPVATPLFAMTAPADATAPFWVQLVPFAMILAIFYFVILMPMRRRQKKVQEFQDGLKVGDRVITTSGIYGSITKIHDRSVQLQIAEKVRIEVAKSSVGGYQGAEPVVPEQSAM